MPTQLTSDISSNISGQLEAVLFWKAEPVSIKKLATLLAVDIDTIREGLAELETSLKASPTGRGLTLIRTDDQVMLGTAPQYAALIQQMTKDELSHEIGKAGLETLSIILYQGPISRADIDHIRGVNSQFILRNLLIRGLVERVDNPQDARSYLYRSTLDLLAHLGISKPEEVPEYEQVRNDIARYKTDASTS